MASPKHNRRLEAENEELKKQVADLRKQLEDSKDQDEDDETQDNAYRSRKPSASAAEKDKEVAKLKEVRAEDYEKIAQLETDLEAKTVNYEKLEQTLQDSKDYADNLQFDLDGMHTLHEEWEEEKKALEAKLKSLEVAVQEETKTTHHQRQALSDMLRQMGDAATEKNQMLDEIRAYGIQNITLQDTLQDREDELARIAVEITPIQEERNQLLEIRTIFSGFFENNLDLDPTSLPDIIRRFMREGAQAQNHRDSFRPKAHRRVSNLADEVMGESDNDDSDGSGDDDNDEDEGVASSDEQDDDDKDGSLFGSDGQDDNDEDDGELGTGEQDGNNGSSRTGESYDGGVPLSPHGEDEETSEQATPRPPQAPPGQAPPIPGSPRQAPLPTPASPGGETLSNPASPTPRSPRQASLPTPASPGQAASGQAAPASPLHGQAAAPPAPPPPGEEQAIRIIPPRNYGELQWWQILLLILIGIIIGHFARKDESKLWLAANDATRQRVVSAISPNAWMMEKGALGG